MTAGAACTVCASPSVASVDADLLDPVRSGYRRIAAAYGLRHDAVRRHKINGHIRAPSAAVVAAATVAARNSTLPPQSVPSSMDDAPRRTAVEVLEAMLHQMETMDTSEFSPRELNVYSENKRRTAESLAKHQVAQDREGPAQRELRALEEMVIAGDEALEQFPEARAAVALAIKQWKARRVDAPEGS